MKFLSIKLTALLAPCLIGMAFFTSSEPVLADGTETLGPPVGITIAPGTGIIAAGTGIPEPGSIEVAVPGNATVEQVLLYWEGQDNVFFTGDDTIDVNGTEVTGTQIGGPIFWPDGGVSTTYRADITSLGLVSPGSNTLTVGGLTFTKFANGAGVLVIIDDGSLPKSVVDIRDGNDLAWIGWDGPQKTTVAQTFNFGAASEARTASLSMFFSAVSGTNSSGGDFRPSAIDVTVGGVTTTFDNLLDSNDGQEWDTLVLPVNIPAGATELTVQALSVDNLKLREEANPASLTWNAAALTIRPVDQPPAVALGDFVWNDLDRDGVQDLDEPGIPNVNVSLRTNCDTANEAVIATDITDGSGLYLFPNLNSGDYCVKFDRTSAATELNCDVSFSPKVGLIDVPNNSDADPITGKTSVVTLVDDDNLNVDAGLFCPPQPRVSLGDYVWEDLNRDGIQNDFRDNGDPTGISGVTVKLYNQCDTNTPAFLEETSTNSDGFYLFDNLEAGAYCVEFVKTTANICDVNIGGSVAFSPNNGDINVANNSDANDEGWTSIVTLASVDNLNVDAGLYCPAKLGNYVWEDTNRDGIQDGGESGIEGVTVTLLACDAAGNTTPTGAPVQTDADGMYMFGPLTPGDYAVQFGTKTGYVRSPADAGSDDTRDSDANTANGKTACTSLKSNEYDDTLDAGLNPAPLSGLGDRVWEDKNANGVQDNFAGEMEPGVSGATVTLLLPGDDGNCNTGDDVFTATTATTDENGEYKFEDLFPGRYCVAFDISTADLACLYGAGPVFTASNSGDDAADSDADRVTGKTGNIDLGILEYDPTNDAGIYCPAKVGDKVWKDEDEDGIQDDSEVGVDAVEVRLYKCDATGNVVGGPIQTASTSGGMYMFDNLVPGSYAVQFIEPADLLFTLRDQGSNDGVDSDADSSGFTACTEVGSNEYDDTLDAGLIDPPGCGLGLVKTCEVVTPPPPPLAECDGKLQSFTLIWNGSGNITVDGIANDAGGVIEPTDEVTFFGPFPSNDNFLTISGAVIGESKFHVSCSDEDMDGETDNPLYPSDCGKAAGDGKGTNGGFINDWLFEGLTDASGQVVDCSPAVTVPTSSCEFDATVASCDTLPEKPTMFSFQYTGGGCFASDNSQGSKFDCSGAISAGSTVTLMTSAGETIEDVEPGDLVTIGKDGSETTITLDDGFGIETIVFHTSCSVPLITGEVFGSLTLTALDGQGSGREVLYSYLVTNDGSNTITGISVTDDVFELIGTVPSLNPGITETLTAMSFVSETTVNTATATGNLGSCVSNEATATVTVTPPPPCTVTSSFKELKDDAIKYTVTNTGTSAATLDEFMLDFPSAYMAIAEVKLDGAIYKSGDSSLVVGPGITIGSGDWTQSDVSKRVLDPGESRTLEIKFTKKAKGFSASDFSGTVKFNDGDCMTPL